MRNTANELINEQYQALFGDVVVVPEISSTIEQVAGGGAAVSSKSDDIQIAIQKLQAISECVDEGAGLFIMEEEAETIRFSKEKFEALLMALARASDADLEIFKEMMALVYSYDREVLFLEIIHNSFFHNNENDCIQDFLNAIIQNSFISRQWLTTILSNSDDENRKRFYDVLVGSIGPHSNIQGSNIKHSDSQNSNADSPHSSNGGPRTVPGSFFSFGSDKPPAHQNRSVSKADPPAQQPEVPRRCESELKEGCNKIIARLTAYLKIREKNPLRNLFHNKVLTKQKVDDAKELINILKKNKDVMAFAIALKVSEINNSQWESTEHTYSFWKSSGGEYGNCLRDCCVILESKQLCLKQYKENVKQEILKLELDRESKCAAINCVYQRQSIKEIKVNLIEWFPNVVEKLKSAASFLLPSKTPGALKIGD